MPEYVIEAVGVQKVFKDFWRRPRTIAVRDLSLKIPRGGVFALLGPNGAGKSTFLKLVLGQLYPTAGLLTVLGVSPRNVAIKSQIGYMPEQLAFWGNLTAHETLMLFGKLQGLSASTVAERIPQLMEMTGITHATHRKVSAFSHGMRKRLGLAQALIHDPDVLILDEPTAGMDPLGCREVKDLILTLAKRGKTVLITSHLLADIEDVANEIAIVFGGSVLAQGNLESLLTQNDKTAFVAENITLETESALSQLFRDRHIDFTLSHPKRSLESYFLDVITQANEKLETSGAQTGNAIADYLKADLPATPTPSVATLTRKNPSESEAPAATPPPVVPESLLKNPATSAPPKETQVNRSVLDQLTKK